MENKECSLCSKSLPIDNFYKSVGYKDGRTKRCKKCVKAKAREREIKLKETPEGIEQERMRHRDKYHRLGYKGKFEQSSENRKKTMDKYNAKFPEKALAKNKSCRMKAKILGNHLHHWSYKIEHAKDVIELSIESHYLAHRFLIYDQERMQYRTTENVLLDTRQSHIDYISKIIFNKK